MASFLELLSQAQPQFQTSQALLVLGLQNDFIAKDGKLPVTDSTGCGTQFLDRIKTLVPTFREAAGDVIWVKTLYKGDRLVNDSTGAADAVVAGEDAVDTMPDDITAISEGESAEEAMLASEIMPSRQKHSRSSQRAFEILKKMSARTKSTTSARRPSSSGSKSASRAAALPTRGQSQHREQAADEELFLVRNGAQKPCCVPSTPGAEFSSVAQTLKEPGDAVVQSSHYSAFRSTDLLLTLRAKLVTSLYVCGCVTNTTVYATAMDAARHGLAITIIDDCLGYRRQARHEQALRQMADIMGATVVSSVELIEELERVDSSEELGELIENLTVGVRPDEIEVTAPIAEIQNHTSAPELLSPDEAYSTTASHGTIEVDPNERPTTPSSRSRSPMPNGQQVQKRQSFVASRLRMRSKRDSTSSKTDRESYYESDRATTPTPSSQTKPRPTSMQTATTTKRSETPTSTDDKAATPSAKPARVTSLPNLLQMSSKDEPAAKTSRSASHTSKERPKVSSSRSATPTKEGKPPSTSKESKSTTSTSKKPSTPRPSRQEDTAPSKSRASSKHRKERPSLANFSYLGPGDSIAEGDSYIAHSLLPEDHHLLPDIFARLYTEVHFMNMSHASGAVPRLVAVQGDFTPTSSPPPDRSTPNRDSVAKHDSVSTTSSLHLSDMGPSVPLYRHPSDHSPIALRFTPAVRALRDALESRTGQMFNHALIQLYRGGAEHITEHSDKTLDIVPGTVIANLSFGAERVMRLRTKRAAAAGERKAGSEKEKEREKERTDRETQRVPLPHNSLFVLGPASNARWLHGIMPDKRPEALRSDAERAFNGWRISLTFRHVGTFASADGQYLWGQGARIATFAELDSDKACEKARVRCGDDGEDEGKERLAMLHAFGKENREGVAPPRRASSPSKSSKRLPNDARPLPSWSDIYASGFSILHFRTPPPHLANDAPLLFAGDDAVATAQVAAALRALGRPEFQTVPAACPPLHDALASAASTGSSASLHERPPLLRDDDAARTEIVGVGPVLLYLDRRYARHEETSADAAAVATALSLGLDLARAWSAVCSARSPKAESKGEGEEDSRGQEEKRLANLLGALEEVVQGKEGAWIAGDRVSVADCAVGPVVWAVRKDWDGWEDVKDRLRRLVKWIEGKELRRVIEGVEVEDKGK